MSTHSAIDRERERLRKDYEHISELECEHFFCPILLEDTDKELCMGHVINDSIPDSSQHQVLQVKDVDGFYGSLVESSFAVLLKGKGGGSWRSLFDRALSRHLRPKIELDGQEVGHYVVSSADDTPHPVVKLVNEAGEFIRVALKVTDDIKLDLCKVQVVVDCNYLAEATATLIKAAHLTMFALFGYRYVFHPAGYHLAKILQNFYIQNREPAPGAIDCGKIIFCVACWHDSSA